MGGKLPLRWAVLTAKLSHARNRPGREVPKLCAAGPVPIYSIGHFAFAIVLVVGIYLMMLRLDPPTAMVVALGSLLGIAAVGSISKPSWMLVAPNQVDQLERLLGEHRYSQRRSGEWVPPLPRWLRWGYNKVGI